MNHSLEPVRAEIRAATTPQTSAFATQFDDLFTELGSAALSRDGGPEHLTASCLVLDPDAEAVLLNHHRKAGLWGQFGGHLEPGDASTRAAAERESLEESGLAALRWLSSDPVDLHVHELSQSFGRCRRHFDVVFAAVASVEDAIEISDESLDVQWYSISELPTPLMPDLVVRLPQLFDAGRRAFSAALSSRD